MKKFLFYIFFLSVSSLFSQSFGEFKMLDKGVIEYNSRYFQTEFAGEYQQSALKSPIVKADKKNYSIAGDFIVKRKSGSVAVDMGGTEIKGGAISASKPVFKFTQNVKRIAGGVELKASMQSTVPNKDAMAFVFYMPAWLYKDRIWIDDKQVKNISAQRQDFLARDIRVVSPNKVLTIKGNFKCSVRVSSWCPQGAPNNIRICIEYLKQSDNLYTLDLKLKCAPTYLGLSWLGENRPDLQPLDLPLPVARNNFVCVNYEIKKDAVGLVVGAGKTSSSHGTKTSPKYLHILNAFESFPEGTDVVGKVVVNYTKGSPDIFEIKKSDTGQINAVKNSPNATLAWRNNWKGKPVALFTTELKLRREPIKNIEYENKTNSNWKIAGVSFSANKVGVIENGEFYITPSDTYQPIVFKRPAISGSALDMSNLLDAPAGKYGRVKVKDGYFVFEKTGKRVRFYGTNTCGSANIPSKEEAVAMAEQFAKMGFNVWRIHHYDAIVTTKKNGDSAELDSEAMDKYDFLFNEMKKRGIYITTDFYTTRKLLPHEYDDINYKGDNMKFVFAASDKGLQNLQRFISNFLNHVNKYTGVAYKDEPALFSVVVRNESSYIGMNNFMLRTPMEREAMQPKYEKWLKSNREKWKKYDGEYLYQMFMLDCYDETHSKLMKTIRSIAPDLLVSDQNHWNGFMTKAMSSSYDFASQNSYFGHPHYIEYKYNLPMHIRSDSPIKDYAGSTVKAFDAGIFSKPLIITEWNYMSPNPHACQGAFLVGAYGALNEVGGLCYFAYAHNKDVILEPKIMGGFDFASNPILTLSHCGAVQMYLREDIKPASISFPIPLLTNFFRNGSIYGWRYSISSYTKLGLIGRVGHVLADNINDIKLPQNASAVMFSEEAWSSANFGNLPTYNLVKDTRNRIQHLPEIAKQKNLDKGKIDLENERYTSSTGEIVLDVKNDCWQAVSPKTEAFILCEGQRLKGNFAIVKSKLSKATVLVSSKDGADLKNSKRILILHLTDVMNSEQKFANAEMDVVLKWGRSIKDAPTLVRAGKIQLILNSSLEGYKLYALETNGARLFEVPIRPYARGKASILNLSVHNKQGSVMAYELVKE